jgi:hypothetical protein
MGSISSKNNSTNQPNSDDTSIQLSEENFIPQGLYPSVNWDMKLLRRQIQTRKLAPFFKGIELGETVEGATTSEDLEECPICFLVRFS